VKTITVKAVIPAAGFGTRLRPITLSVPKELLPVGRKPMIQLAVEEAIAAGIKHIAVVIRRDKELIRHYLEALRSLSDPTGGEMEYDLSEVRLHYAFQEKPLGLGNAIYEAGRFVGDSPFVMIIPDQFVRTSVPASKQLVEAASADFHAVWSSMVSVPPEELAFFPGALRRELNNRIGNVWEITAIKQETGYANEGPFLGFGRTFFPAGVLEFFSESFANPSTGEVDLLLSFESLIKNYRNYAVLIEGRAMDFGTWAGYEHFFRESSGCFDG